MVKEFFLFLIQTEVCGCLSPALWQLVCWFVILCPSRRDVCQQKQQKKKKKGLYSNIFILLLVMRNCITYLMSVAADISWRCSGLNLSSVSYSSSQDLITTSVWWMALAVCKINFIIWLIKDKTFTLLPMDNEPCAESQFKWSYTDLVTHGPEMRLCLKGAN